MIRFPGEWIQHVGVNLATGLPPGLGARFRYFEREQPQPSFSTIVARVLASDPELVVHEVGEMMPIVTREGEYGAWVAIDGVRGGRRAHRTIGAVFMHEFAAVLDCIAILPQHFAQLDALSLELVRSASFQMAQRPRPFFYKPPVGWQAIPSGVAAGWYPPDFPGNATNLVVPPAALHAAGPDYAAERSLAELRVGIDVHAEHRADIVADAGHPGLVLHVHGQRAGVPLPLHRELVAFVVAGRLYRFRLETTNAARLDELRAVLRGVARSFHPLPGPDEVRRGIPFASASSALDHWRD